MSLSRFLTVLALAALPVLALAPAPRAGEEHGAHGDHLATLGELRLVHAWTRATEDDHALVFVEIDNTGEAPVTLTGAASAIAEGAELVGFRLEEGEPGYVALGKLPVAPGTEMALAPEGLALRLEGLAGPLTEGETFPVEIVFDAGRVEMIVQVEAADATQHGHAGHAH